MAMPGPGLSTERTETPRTFLLSDNTWEQAVTVASAARDAGNTDTQVLRAGLVMGYITASVKYAQYDDSAADGTQVARGILKYHVRLKDDDGNACDGSGVIVCGGYVDEDQLVGLDANARTDMAFILFKDEVCPAS